MKRPQEPRGELARYAFGYSNRRPGRVWWIMHGIMVAVVVWHMVRIAP